MHVFCFPLGSLFFFLNFLVFACACVYGRVKWSVWDSRATWLTAGLDWGGRVEQSFNTTHKTQPFPSTHTCIKHPHEPNHTGLESLFPPFKDRHRPSHRHHTPTPHTDTTGTSPHPNLSAFDSFQQWSTHAHTHADTQTTPHWTLDSDILPLPTCHSTGCLWHNITHT